MFCPNCGKPCGDGNRFCPNCGNALAAAPAAGTPIRPAAPAPAAYPYRNAQPAQQPYRPQPVTQQPMQQRPVQPYQSDFAHSPAKKQKPQQKKKGKPALIAAIALVLVAAIAAGVLFFLPQKSGSAQNPFAAEAKTADKDSSNHDVLTVFGAAYDTLFGTKSLSCSLTEDGYEYFTAKADFGKDLPSTNVYFSTEGDFSLAMYDGQFSLLFSDYYGEGIRINAKEIGSDLERAADNLYGQIDETLRNNNMPVERLHEADGNPLMAGLIYHFMTMYDSSRKPAADMILHVVQNNSLCPGDLFSFAEKILGFAYGINGSDLPSMDEIFGVAADFLAEMPEDAIDISNRKSGDKTEYTYSFDLQKVGLAFVDYAENNETIRVVAGPIIQRIFGYSLTQWFSSMREELNMWENMYVSGTVQITDGTLRSVTVNIDGDEYRLRFSNVNETAVSRSEYERVDRSIRNAEADLQDTDDLIELMEEGLN